MEKSSRAWIVRSLILLLTIILSISLITIPSYAENKTTPNTPIKDTTQNGDANEDKVDGGTIAGGNSHTAAGTGESVKGDEGFRLYLIDKDGNIVSKVVDFYYPDAPHKPFIEKWEHYKWNKFAVSMNASVSSLRSQKERPSLFYNAGEFECFEGLPHLTFNPSGGPSGGSEIEAWSHQKDENGVENINHVVAQIFENEANTTSMGAVGSLGRGWHEYKRFMAGEYQLVMEGL